MKGDAGRVKAQEIKELMEVIQDLKKENKLLRTKQNGPTNEILAEF